MDAAASPTPPVSPTAPAAAPAAPAPQPEPKAAPKSDWTMTPQQRFEQQQRDVDNLYGASWPGIRPGEKVDDATYAKMTYAERVAYAEQFEWQPGDRQPADPAAPPTIDPSAERVKIGEVDATEAEWRDALAFKAAEDAKRLSLPATPKDYRLDLPKDLKLPAGVAVTFNEADPVLAPVLDQARNWAKANNLTQEQFSQALGLHAAAKAHEQAVINAAATGERDKLGAAGSARVDAVSRWIRAQGGDDLARPVLATLVTSKQVEFFEQLIQRATSQGVGSFSQKHRDIDTGKLDNAAYEKLSYTQKKEYAARWPQS